LIGAWCLRAVEPALQWRGRRGLLVAVLGPDGAGKSTLLKRLGNDWAWPHQRVYFGLWPDVRRQRRVASALWPVRRPFRAMRRYAVGLLASCRGRLVLFDRYVYDAAVPPQGRHLTLKRIYFQVLLRCAPAPDLVILLEAPGEVLFARKGEMDPVTLDAHRDAVSRHVHRVSARSGRPVVAVVDATRSPADVAEASAAAIWSLAARRLDRSGRTS
jgi:thymidylate kinase